LNPYPENEEDERPLNYKGWWGLPALPKFNTDNPGVRAYLFDVAEYWTRFGIDGWRLDVPADIDDDSFWQEFRQRVRAINPEAYIVGEIWHRADRWLQGDQFDAVMNYPMGTAALSFFGFESLRKTFKKAHLDYTPVDAGGMVTRVGEVLSWYDWEVTQAQLNLIDSHDMPRALWLLQGDKTALLQCLGFILTLPGAPCIYYGTEVGMSGADDPHCREAFPWHQPEQLDWALRDQIKALCQVRHALPILRRGSVTLSHIGKDVLVAQRILNKAEAWVVYNRSHQDVRAVTLSGGLPPTAALQRVILGTADSSGQGPCSIALYSKP
ncbi:MAG: alpha-amylase family glycosyl hydrolase, partial [Natronospirillum sp.]